MNQNEYLRISKELQDLSKTIPLNWGSIQNNKTDSKINMFALYTKEQLEKAIAFFDKSSKTYYRRRWFIWQCSRIDEYLFYKALNVLKNPISKDQNWDVEFNNDTNLRFDIKGTVVPKSMRKNFKISDEEKIIKFYYNNQSRGVRFNIQNRLFIVHHSNYKAERSMYLRCHWKLKEKAYESFTKGVSEINFISYKSVISKCIFIIENENNEFNFKIN